MHIQALGHVVLKVRNLERSVQFYRDILGIKEVARYRGAMVFFSFGSNHHDLALLQLGEQASHPAETDVGLYHVALKVGDTLDELRACKAHLERHGVTILGTSDHNVSQSVYIQDPDGIDIELYVDADPALWKDNPEAVAVVRPLRL
ncbi:catechol 2,3-dioxygenase [Gallionellaceae bacterium]|nr:catechol 2,3-dioxygenase [Gallionellaceae bacterium]